MKTIIKECEICGEEVELDKEYKVVTCDSEKCIYEMQKQNS